MRNFEPGEQPTRTTCGERWESVRSGTDVCLRELGHAEWTHRGRFAEWMPSKEA